MLMDIQCSSVPQIEIRLSFDNGKHKTVIVSQGDLVDILYNKNGMRRRIEGIVTKISTNGTEVYGWCIIVDGSGDFSSEIARISPKNILDIDIIRKADTVNGIDSPRDKTGIMSLKIVKGRLLFSQNGYDWFPVVIDRENVIVHPEDNNLDPRPHPPVPPNPIKPDEGWSEGELPDFNKDDGVVTDGNDILDEVY